MAERRLPLSVTDDDGVERQGELLITSAWRPDLVLSPTAKFTIILSERPNDAHALSIPTLSVVVCLPSSPVSLSKVAGETAVARAAAPALARLPRRALAAFAAGGLAASFPLRSVPSDIFGNGASPRFDVLAREVIAAARRSERYWRALDEVLSFPRTSGPPIRPDQMRTRLRGLLAKSKASASFVDDAIARLDQLSERGEPTDVWPSPAALAEDVALVRCAVACLAETAALDAMRRYVDAAAVPERLAQLHIDALATREQLSFVTLLAEPRRIESMRAAFEAFQAAYGAAYEKHHRAYWQAAARTAVERAELAPVVSALRRLNTLRALGRPLGRADLAAYERLATHEGACGGTDLGQALRDEPRCAACAITLDVVDQDEVARLSHRLEAALGKQQARLAAEAVRRILARGGERIDQFLGIVQASDQAGLVRVLDDELVAFIRDLLEQPPAPTPDALSLLEELARAYPTVGAEQIDEVAAEFRRVLAERLLARSDSNGVDGATIQLGARPRIAP